MKKLFTVFTVLFFFLMTGAMCFAQGSTDSTTFNLSLTMAKYIESLPTVDWFLGSTHYTNLWGPPRLEIHVGNEWDLAYSNTPFQVTIEGSNEAGNTIPRFARNEVGDHANGWDILPTTYNIKFLMNGVWYDFTDWWDGASQFPITRSYMEAPHNGQVKMRMNVEANGTTTPDPGMPVRQIAINPAFTWDQSADAGLYECNLLVTFTAL